MGIIEFIGLAALALALSGAIKSFWRELQATAGEQKVTLWQMIGVAVWRSLPFLVLSALLVGIFLWERQKDLNLREQQSQRVLELLSQPTTFQFLSEETGIPSTRLLDIIQVLEAQGTIESQREPITLGDGRSVPVRLIKKR